MKEAPTEGSFILNSMGEQGITGGDDLLLKMSFSGQSLEKHSVPETHVQAQSGRYFFLISIHRSFRTVQWVRIPHILWEATPEGEWRSMEKQEDGRDSLSFASFLVFFINAENLANTSFPAELDSGCWVPSLGYLEKFKARVSQISNVWVRRIQSGKGRNDFLWAHIKMKTAP